MVVVSSSPLSDVRLKGVQGYVQRLAGIAWQADDCVVPRNWQISLTVSRVRYSVFTCLVRG